MRDFQNVGAVAHVIQLSVAPVFLLTAIGTMLSVMTNRLARIIDRARHYEAKLEVARAETIPSLHQHLATLSKRADLMGRAIFLCTSTAVLVCTVIALLFLGDYLRYDMSLPGGAALHRRHGAAGHRADQFLTGDFHCQSEPAHRAC